MDMFNVLNVITDTTKVPGLTHCGGINNEPPILSGPNDFSCNAPGGCNSNASVGTHHGCDPRRIFYCTCPSNNDREKKRIVKHYFVRSNGINAFNHCVKCQLECGAE